MPSKNEVALLRDQITEEVNRDAQVISTQLFGSTATAREPDLGRVSDEQLRGLYRQKYLSQDRQWLQGEARRDPLQFEKIARSIGVVLPEEIPGLQPSPATLPQGPLPPSGVSAFAAPQVPQVALPVAGPPGPVDPLLAQAALQQAQGGLVAGVPPPGPQPVQPPLPMSY